MKIKTPGRIVFCCLILFSICAGCSRDETNFYADKEAPGIAIFSNRGNNVLSCFIDGKPWRTIDRTSGGLSRTEYELLIERIKTNSPADTLTIQWNGHYSDISWLYGTYLKIVLPIAKNFKLSDLSAFRGKRIQIDSTNGFFSLNTDGDSRNTMYGTGSIYFNTISFDSFDANGHNAYMSGLLEANFNTTRLSSGRFDHIVVADEVRF